MSILNRVWVRGITGIGVAALIIAGSTLIYPMTATNSAGHIMVWVMAAVIGIKITLSAIDNEGEWMEPAQSAGEKVAEEMPAIKSRAQIPATSPAMMELRGRMPLKPLGAITLEYPRGLDRGRYVNTRYNSDTFFHEPETSEKQDCIRFAAENPICSLATIDEKDAKQPHVRTVFLWRVDETGFYFILFSTKNVSRQVKAQPKVELCFQNHPQDISTAKQLRISGQMGLLENRKLKEEASNDRSILNKLAGEGNDADIEIYHISEYEMNFWQMGTIARRANAQVAAS